MATTIQLQGNVRVDKGKGVARKLRQIKRVPGVVYGKGRDPILLDLDEREFVRAVSAHSASNLIVDLVFSGADTLKTLIREIQVDPLSGSVLHVDLNQISLTDMIEVEIPIELDGVPVGVKNSGGILQHPVRTLSIKCLPQNMPDVIRLDVSNLEIGDVIRAGELGYPDVEIMAEHESILASVAHPTKVEEVVPVEGEEEVEAEPEVVGKEKKEDEGEGATES